MLNCSLTEETALKTGEGGKTLAQLEQELAGAFEQIAEGFHQIELQKKYQPQYPSFAVYLFKRWGRSLSWYKQTRASATAAKKILEEYGITLGNEAAGRDVRKLLHRQVDSEITPRVLRKAQMLAGEGEPILGKHIKSIIAVTCEVLDTGGYVWVEESQVAYNSAMVGEVAEAVKRQKTYAAEGAKGNGWSKPTLLLISTFGAVPQGPPHLIEWYDSLPPGTEVEVKWRIVDAKE